jgi:hypothetical protein
MQQPLTKPLASLRFFAAILVFATTMTCQTLARNRDGEGPSKSPQWEKTFGQLRHMQLADPANAYDSAHFLMLPMQRAFETGDLPAQQLFAGLVANLDQSTYADLNLLTRMQLDYFVSEYLVLKSSTGLFDTADRALLKQQWRNFERYWVEEPFKHWATKPYAGVRGRLVSILSGPMTVPGRSYVGAATDFELFGLAIAANLKIASRKGGDVLPGKTALLAEEASRFAFMTVQGRGEFIDGGWLFQRGFWRDHGDFLYAGHGALAPDLNVAPLVDVAQDSSHSIRWPLWIRSFYKASGNESEKAFFAKVAFALSAQYRGKVIRQTDQGLIMNNYMDGRNGVYRYKYATVGSNVLNGYGPDALSGSLFIGWLCFLPDMEAPMRAMKESFPLTPAMVELYTGPNTVRQRNPLFAQPGFYTNGTAELISALSVDCSRSADVFWHAR